MLDEDGQISSWYVEDFAPQPASAWEGGWLALLAEVLPHPVVVLEGAGRIIAFESDVYFILSVVSDYIHVKREGEEIAYQRDEAIPKKHGGAVERIAVLTLHGLDEDVRSKECSCYFPNGTHCASCPPRDEELASVNKSEYHSFLSAEPLVGVRMARDPVENG